MPSRLRRWQPKTRLGKVWTACLLLWLVLTPLTLMPRAGDRIIALRMVLIILLIVLGIPLLMRWVRRKFLWKLSNRLIVNYLLIGLAPFVLLLVFFGLMGYSLAGQFAIVAANSELDRGIASLSSEDRATAVHAIRDLKADPYLTEGQVAKFEGSGRTVEVFLDRKYIPAPGGRAAAAPPIQPPSWTQGSFAGVVVDNKRFYLRAVDTVSMEGHVATVITSEPFIESRLARMGEGIGRVTLIGQIVREDSKGRNIGSSADLTQPKPVDSIDLNFSSEGTKVRSTDSTGKVTEETARLISGGTLPPSAGLYDINVTFLTLLPVRSWVDGQPLSAPLSVSSRPSALYHRLFAISNRFGNFIRIALISLGVTFALIELFALIMAARLNRTITRSVHDLYEATVRVDAGDLSHQIEVKRTDQLAELGRSFNRMTTSLQRLIEEQKEKERMQSELAIAQEVQNNLFPHGDVRLPALEVHGICRPARTVSGDYYDFLVLGEDSVEIALGDISGKGISAALLMATLHSAVRAYRFASQEMLKPEKTLVPAHAGANGTNGPSAIVEYAEMFESPANILALLNRHLYRSTQPEKYATLWLSQYDGARRRLTYSNGGHLPPLVLRGNGSVERLDRGGMVIGLFDGCEYDEGALVLEAGDILVAYSDGVTEPENDYGEFGEERLVEIVQRYRHDPLSAISARVLLALQDWIGAQEQPDDITLVLARQL